MKKHVLTIRKIYSGPCTKKGPRRRRYREAVFPGGGSENFALPVFAKIVVYALDTFQRAIVEGGNQIDLHVIEHALIA